MSHVVIFGGGQIGRAVSHIFNNLPNLDITWMVWDKDPRENVRCIDVEQTPVEVLTQDLLHFKTTHVINAMPFFLNETVANAAAAAGCNYIDFTEDDMMADVVQLIYRAHPKLTCAVKCGLAPGFINYIGHDLVSRLDNTEDLMISVGALPRNVNWSPTTYAQNYNLSWSVDGLVNEYIRPCRVRMFGQELTVAALTGREQVIADGVAYEAAFTSGGIGSLVKELKNVKNVAYKTLRYPGHYDYVIQAVNRNNFDFDAIKSEFLKTFPFNKDDVIVVYAEAVGKKDGVLRRETFANHFVGSRGLTGIQSTTAAGGVAVFELMLRGVLKGVINHADVLLHEFTSTEAFKHFYTERNSASQVY